MQIPAKCSIGAGVRTPVQYGLLDLYITLQYLDTVPYEVQQLFRDQTQSSTYRNVTYMR